MKTITLTMALAALAAGGSAYAQAGERTTPGAAMTQQQATARADKAFQRLDANGDDKLDDADRIARMQKMFARLDADRNGSVTFAEFQAARADRGDEQRAGQRPERGQPGKHHGKRGGMGMQHMARTADANEDGAISQAEFRSAALARFEAADTNKDGSITPDERRAGRGSQRGMARPGPAG